MKRLYVSGPMGGYKNWNFPAFNDAAYRLRSAGYDVENPATKGIIAGFEWADYLKLDLKLMLDCDGIAVLPGWHLSRGAKLEIDVAERLGIEVRDLARWL